MPDLPTRAGELRPPELRRAHDIGVAGTKAAGWLSWPSVTTSRRVSTGGRAPRAAVLRRDHRAGPLCDRCWGPETGLCRDRGARCTPKARAGHRRHLQPCLPAWVPSRLQRTLRCVRSYSPVSRASLGPVQRPPANNRSCTKPSPSLSQCASRPLVDRQRSMDCGSACSGPTTPSDLPRLRCPRRPTSWTMSEVHRLEELIPGSHADGDVG